MNLMRLLVLATLFSPGIQAAVSPPEVLDLLRNRHETSGSIWPGFDPARIPVAVFDGQRTFLMNHPAPPPEFRIENGYGVMEGRFPAITSNSSIEIGGMLTATVMPVAGDLAPDERAGLMAHEMFHVLQRSEFTGWSGNEADVFTYPYSDEQVMVSRIVEENALRAALQSNKNEACGLATVAMQARQARFDVLTAAHREYERRSELNEGLAEYIQARYAGRDGGETIPEKPFAPDAIRWRVYRTGAAMAFLLDDFLPDWKEILVGEPEQWLDEMLMEALADHPECIGTDDRELRKTAGTRAAVMTREFRDRLQRIEKEYLDTPGVTVRLVADENPFWPEGFDPLNVSILDSGRVLHSRFLKLGNAAGKLEVLGRSVLTRGQGEHPLFNGIAEVLLTGLDPDRVIISESGIEVKAAELRLQVNAKRIERKENEILVVVE